MSVSLQEGQRYRERDALVAVHERMVQRQRPSVGGSQIEGVGNAAVKEMVARTVEGGIEELLSDDALSAPVLSKESFMDGKCDSLGDPLGLACHFPSSRSAFLYLRITPSATFIVSSNSGS